MDPHNDLSFRLDPGVSPLCWLVITALSQSISHEDNFLYPLLIAPQPHLLCAHRHTHGALSHNPLPMSLYPTRWLFLPIEKLCPHVVVMYTPNLLRLTPIILVMLRASLQEGPDHSGLLTYIPGGISAKGQGLLSTMNSN